MKRKNSSPGMFTVEMSIVFPIVLLSIMAVFYYSAVHYQNIALKVNTQRINSRIAVSMSNGDQGHNNILECDGSNWDTVFSPTDMEHPSLFEYGLLNEYGIDLNVETQIGIDAATQFDFSPYMISSSQSLPEIDSNLFFSWVVIHGERSYSTPFGNLFHQIGIDIDTSGNAESRQMIQDIPNYFWNYRAIKNIREIKG